MKDRPTVLIVGGGPAGMMAAGQAALGGARAVLLEKGPKTGRKLRMTGKGRCNLTNTADLQAFIQAFAPNGKFLYSAFSQFFRDDLLRFFEEIGVPTKEERGGRVFPASDSALEVAGALEGWMARCGVQVRPNARVRSLIIEDGQTAGVELYDGAVRAGAVVVATGGASYPRTGSSGDGYELAKAAGHTVVPPRPALSALITAEKWVPELQGLSLKNVEARLVAGPPDVGKPKVAAREFGEMLFTHNGVSGPIILTLSRRVPELLARGPVYVLVDLKPALTREQLQARFIREFAQTRHFKNYLPELLPKSMVDLFPRLARIPPDKPLNQISAEERHRLIETLKGLRVAVRHMGPLEEAIATAGGVCIREIEPKTMMSRLVPGLFFVGEVIDIDAETGGYNLQAAFSTGFAAGRHAARFAQI
ncbi:MAG: NAD(P)/FAD-dependent oxidoreductase [Armatimonadetes bacterium]|nr:NAD(P)/FAD-dependent oxidoreductase [Armatimonadota bacterium]